MAFETLLTGIIWRQATEDWYGWDRCNQADNTISTHVWILEFQGLRYVRNFKLHSEIKGLKLRALLGFFQEMLTRLNITSSKYKMGRACNGVSSCTREKDQIIRFITQSIQ